MAYYCAYCGNKIDDSVLFCPMCGARNDMREEKKYNRYDENRGEHIDLSHTFGRGQSRYTSPEAMKGSTPVAILSFIFPLLGFILWYVWGASKPGHAASALKGALVSVSFGSPIIGLIIFLINKNKNKSLAKACGIAAIVGVVFIVLMEILIFTLMPELEEFAVFAATRLIF